MYTEIKSFLSQFIELTEEQIQIFLTKLEQCSYKKKEIVTEIGEVENHIHFIKKGLLLQYLKKGKATYVTHIIKESGLMGSAVSFISGKPSHYRIIAIEPTITFRISRTAMEELYSLDHKFEKFRRIINSHFLIKQELHILDGLRLTVRERFLKFVNENPDLVLRVPQKYLAAYLNIKQETFSRMKHLVLKKKSSKA